MSPLEFGLLLVGIYLICGMIFSAAFLSYGIGKIDEAAKGAALGFRLLLVPGCITFWPWLALKWFQATPQQTHE